MSFSSHRYLATIFSALLAATLASTLACQSAQKTSFMPPAQAQAPSLVAASSPPDPHQQKPAASAAQPQSRPQVPLALEVDPVADLIARVEKEYQSGQDNYRAGHLEAAKQNFDSAFNQLLGSGFDLNGDDRLEHELDRILEGINGLELAALQQGDGFAEQKSEPAPIDEANELTPAVDQNVKAKAEAEIKSTRSGLPLVMTDQVAGYINYYSNRGRGTLERALARSGRYEDMIRRNGLPKETRNYFPIIVAVTIMAKNPAQYGLDSVVKEKPVPYDTVKIGYPIDLRLAAECVDATAEDLLDLNPSLLRLTTPKGHEFDLHLPPGTPDKFQTAVASIPADKRVSWRYHKVQGGETLASIAPTYHTTPRAIAEANDIDGDAGPNNASLSPETRLIIPIAPGKQVDTSTYAHATTHYKIRKGDTVESVAENFGVSARMLRVWNRLKGSSLAGRRILYLHLPVTRSASETQFSTSHSTASRHPAARTQTASANAVLHHRVKRGETLSSIATSYNTTVSALKHDNRNIAALRPGMILVVHNLR